MFHNPFGKKTSLKFVPVGSPETGIIYLLDRKLKVRENPVDAQESAIKQADLLALINTASLRLAEAKGVKEETAREMLFPKLIDGVEVAASENLTKWLSSEEASKYYQLLVTTAPKNKVATLFLRNRLGFPVVLTARAKAKVDSLVVEPLRFDLVSGDYLEFENFRVQVTEPVAAGSETIDVKPLPSNLEVGAIAFLIDFQTNQKKVGIAQWSEADTEDLDEVQVDAIYEFYQRQIGLPVVGSNESSEVGNAEQVESQPLESNLKTLESLPTVSQLTGSTAGSDSKQEALVSA